MLRPLSDFATGARVRKPDAIPFDFAYQKTGIVCREGERVGVVWDGGEKIYQYPRSLVSFEPIEGGV